VRLPLSPYLSEMKAFAIILLALLINTSATVAQTKVFFSAGTNTTNTFFIDGVYIFGKGDQVFGTKNEYQQKGFFNFLSAEIY